MKRDCYTTPHRRAANYATSIQAERSKAPASQLPVHRSIGPWTQS